MTGKIERNVFLTGTPIVEPERTILRAGDLEAEYDEGAVRWVCWKGVEVVRAIMFLVRTPGWGTPPGVISSLSIDECADGFNVNYDAYYGETGAGVLVSISLSGSSDGTVSANAVIKAEVPFETNRSGFVVLHPMDGFAGTEVLVDHASSDARSLVIPIQISPGQPVMDIRAITHKPVEGLTVKTRFEGDIFEMEDHRNWSDASFKTYSRPIGLPYPYDLSPDEPVKQAVHVTITDKDAAKTVSPAVSSPAINGQTLPHFALPINNLAETTNALAHIEPLKVLAPQRILLRFDVSIEVSSPDFSQLAQLLRDIGSALELQIILNASDDAGADIEIGTICDALSKAGVAAIAVSGFAKIDEQSFQPGQERPPHPSEQAIATSLRKHFPNAYLVGGTPAFFTEFNRKRPDPALWQGLTFATTPIVHAADDASLMETLQSLPHIFASAAHLSGGLPISVGPTGIGARLNPYGPAPTDNAPQDREGMAAQDPRQRGLMASSWIVGYMSQIAGFDLERFAFGGASGPFGLLSSSQPYARTYWDDQPDGQVYPLYHVAKWINAAAGSKIESATYDNFLATIVWTQNGKRTALIANLTPKPQTLTSTPLSAAKALVLDASTIETLAAQYEPDLSVTADSVTELDAYGVVFLQENL